MARRLHFGGRFRRWLGARAGGGFELGDRLLRRALHGMGAGVVLYYLLPEPLFGVVPKEAILLGLLGVVLLLEGLRFGIALELPTVRSYERARVGSYVYYAIALTGALLLFPKPIGAAIALGTAIVDPLGGELRGARIRFRLDLLLPFVVYAVLAVLGLVVLGGWPWGLGTALALPAALIAVAVERPRLPWLDDDLTMTFVPGMFLYVVGVIVLGLPS